MADVARTDAGDFTQLDAELDALIWRRHHQRESGKGGFDPTQEQLWAESERRHAEGLRRASAWAWVRHHEDLAVLFHRLADEHTDKAAALIAELEAEAAL